MVPDGGRCCFPLEAGRGALPPGLHPTSPSVPPRPPGRDFPHCVPRNRSARLSFPAAAASRGAASLCPFVLQEDVRGTLLGWSWEEKGGSACGISLLF